MDLKTKIMALIEEGWDRNRPPGGVGTTDSSTIYTRLLAEGVDVSPGAMARILEDLSAEGQITGPQAIDREDKQLHGARAVPGQLLNPSGGCDALRETKALVA